METVIPNCEELMMLYWAAAKTGIVIVPGSPLLQASGLMTLLRDSDTVIVFADAEFAETLDKIKDELPAIQNKHWILLGENKITYGFKTNSYFIEEASTDEPPDAQLSDDDVYKIMYSSGTTGAPKVIVQRHYVHAKYCTYFASVWRMAPESIVLHSGAIVFNGAMLDLMPWMFLGATYILQYYFDAGTVLAKVEKGKVTHMIMEPAQINALLKHPDIKT